MKKLFILLFIGVLLTSCTKDDSSSSPASLPLVSVPDAKVEYDNSNFGIYKGVFVGSSGIVKINIKNDSALSAIFIIDGIRYDFTTAENVFENHDIVGLTFTSGDKSFDFNCNANGDNIVINAIHFPEHIEASINVMKEFSDTLITCYQGSYTGATDHGAFNIMMAGETVYGLALSDLFSTVLYISGNIQNSTISGTMENGSFSGNLYADNMSGIWENESENTGTWTAKRTL